MTLFCYASAGAVNLLWLLLGDRLSLWIQMSIPVVSVGLVAIGAAVRLTGLHGSGRRRYVRRTLWAVLIYYLAILSVLLFFGGLFTWTGPGAARSIWSPSTPSGIFSATTGAPGACPACLTCWAMWLF